MLARNARRLALLSTIAATFSCAALQGATINWTTGTTLDASGSWAGPSTFNGQAYTTTDDLVIDGSAAKTITTSGVITSPLSLTISSTNATTLSGTSIGSAPISLNGTSGNTARIIAGNGAVLGIGAISLGTAIQSQAAYASGMTPFLRVNGGGTQNVANDIALPSPGSTTYFALQSGGAAGSVLNLNGNITGGGANTVLQLDTPNSGDGTTVFNLAGNNTLAGQIRLNRGRLILSNANALGTASLFIQTNGNATNGSLSFNGFTTLTNNVIIGSTTAQWINPGSVDVTLSGVVSSATNASGGFSKMGSGALILTGANTYNGSATAVADGSLSFTGSGRINSADYTGTLALTATTSILNYASSTNQGLTGVISGAGQITKSGTSVLTLSGTNTFTGGTTISSGTVAVGNNAGLGTGAVTANASFGAGYVSGGTPFLRTSTSGLTINNDIVLSSTAGYYGLQSGTAAGGSVTWSGIISGGGSGTVLQIDTPNAGDSTSVATLGGNNTIAGQIRLNRGRLILANTNALGTATLFMQTPGNATNGNLSFSGVTSLSNDLIIGTTVNQWINPGTATVTMSGIISSATSGSGGFSKLGTGTLVLTGANTYNGTSTTVADGTLSISGSGRINSSAYTGTLVLNSATSVLDYASSTNQTLTGVVSGPGSIVKSGSSTLTLSGANTYTGPTTVNNGTLVLTGAGAISDTLTLAAGSTVDVTAKTGGLSLANLLGVGAINSGANTVTVSSTLNPGASPGTLNFTGDLALTSSTLLFWDLDATSQTVGSGVNDLAAVTGNFTLDGTLNVNAIGSFAGVTSGTWTIATYTGTLTDSGLSLGSLPALDSGYQWSLNSGSGSNSAVILSIAAIPEPSTLVFGSLVLLGFAGVGLRRRSQKP